MARVMKLMSAQLVQALKVGFERQAETSMVGENVIDVAGPIDLEELADHLIHSCGVIVTYNGQEIQ